MAFPFLAAATLAAPLIGGLFGGGGDRFKGFQSQSPEDRLFFNQMRQMARADSRGILAAGETALDRNSARRGNFGGGSQQARGFGALGAAAFSSQQRGISAVDQASASQRAQKENAILQARLQDKLQQRSFLQTLPGLLGGVGKLLPFLSGGGATGASSAQPGTQFGSGMF